MESSREQGRACGSSDGELASQKASSSNLRLASDDKAAIGSDVSNADKLGESVSVSGSGSESPPSQQLSCYSSAFWFKVLRFIGPGFLISMAYIDPGNLSADVNQGVSAGYTLSWVTFWALVMAFVVQMLAAKLGLVADKHMSQLCRAEYPAFPRYVLWIAAELGVIASDMIEVVGGAVALNTISSGAIPLWGGVLITAAGAFVVLALERYGMRLLEAILMVLIATMSVTFGYMFFSTGVDYAATLKGIAVPQLNSNTITLAVGAIGAVLMPHNMFLQSALVKTRADETVAAFPLDTLRYVRIESGLATFLSFIINLFIIAVSANAFFGSSSSSSGFDPASIGLGNVGQAFGALYGKHIMYIWGVGLLAAAFASTVTSTYAGQVVTTGFLNIDLNVWWRTIAVRLITLGPTMAIAALLRSESDMTGLTEVLNTVQSLVLPLVFVALVTLTSSKKVMGVYANRLWSVVALWVMLAFLLGMNGYLAISFGLTVIPSVAWARALFGLVCAAYGVFVIYLFAGPRRVHRVLTAGAKKAAASATPAMRRAVDVMEVHI